MKRKEEYIIFALTFVKHYTKKLLLYGVIELFEDTEEEYFGLRRKIRRMLFKNLDKRKKVVSKEIERVFFLLQGNRNDGIPILLNHETLGPITAIFIVNDESFEGYDEDIEIAVNYISNSGVNHKDLTTIYQDNLILFMHRSIGEWFLEMEDRY